MFLRRVSLTLRDAVTFIAFAILSALIIARLDQAETVRLSGAFRVSDGDTLARGGERLRLVGIDAPERLQTCGAEGRRWSCGAAARAALQTLAAGGGVECEGHSRDRYGRLLVTCRAGSRSVNAEMVRQGMAIAYGDRGVDYRAEEAEAKAARRGVWSGPFERPQDWRRMKGSLGDDGGLTWLGAAVGRFFGYDADHEREE